MVFRKIDKQLKERALWLLERGFRAEQVQIIQGVSESSLKRWQRNLDTYGNVLPPQNPLQSRPRILTADQTDELLELLTDSPCLYLDEIQDFMAFTHDIALSQSRYDSLLRDCGISYKQLRKTPIERDPIQRAEFHEWCTLNVTARMLITTDESSKDDRIIYRRYGRAPRGVRAEMIQKYERGQRYSILPAMTIEGYIAVRVVEDSVDGFEFMDFIANEVVSFGRSAEYDMVHFIDEWNPYIGTTHEPVSR